MGEASREVAREAASTAVRGGGEGKVIARVSAPKQAATAKATGIGIRPPTGDDKFGPQMGSDGGGDGNRDSAPNRQRRIRRGVTTVRRRGTTVRRQGTTLRLRPLKATAVSAIR